MIKNFTHFTPTEITHIKGKINSVGILQKVFPEIWEEILCESNYPKIIGIGRLCRIIRNSLRIDFLLKMVLTTKRNKNRF